MSNSLFELLGRSREKVLSQRPVIPPPGTLNRGNKLPEPPRFNGGPVASDEKGGFDLFEVDGDPILVVDDELDVSTITPEDGIPDEDPMRVLGVRVDTAIVFGIGVVLVVVIAFLVGRVASKPPEPPKETGTLVAPATRPAPPPELEKPAEPSPEKKIEASPEKPAEKPAEPTANKFEIQVVTTSADKAQQLVKWFNESPESCLAGKGPKAFVKGTREVRIGGISEQKLADDIFSSVKSMPDPTSGGKRPGAFAGARLIPQRG